MKNKVKVLALIAVLVLSLQIGVYAETEETEQLSIETEQTTTVGFTAQPRGVYLFIGNCYILPGSGYVTVWGSTEAYSKVSEISVTLTILKELAPNAWKCVWEDTFTDYNTDYANFNKQNVNLEPGRYKIEGTHTTKHAGRTETNTSVSGIVTVY